MKKIITALLSVMVMVTMASAEKIGEVKTSGMIFKDRLVIEAFDDGGVTCYVGLPKKSMSFSDQTDSSISCRQTGIIQDSQKTFKKSVFTSSKSPFFKNQFVTRFYDSKRNVLVYISYTEKMSGDNANNSVSVVVIKDK